MAGLILGTILQWSPELRDGLAQAEAAVVRLSPLDNRAKGKLLVRSVRVGMSKDTMRSIFGREISPIQWRFGYGYDEYEYEEYGVRISCDDGHSVTHKWYAGPALDKRGRPLPP